MKKNSFSKKLSGFFFSRNWEANIEDVSVQACSEDPLGYRAVYSMRRTAETFVIGASLLAQRERNLTCAGYKLPMTERAIAAIERKLGTVLPEKIEALARAV